MNCQLCKNHLDAYIGGRLPEDVQSALRTHLEGCEECNSYYISMIVTGKMVEKELTAEPNPFLATRIMAKVESLQEAASAVRPSFARRVLQPALVTLMLAAAVFAGITAGKAFYSSVQPGGVPEELVYLNDASLESLTLFTTE